MSNPRTIAVDMPPDDAGDPSGAPVVAQVAVSVPDDAREPVRRSGARLAQSGAGASDPVLAAQLAARKSERMAARSVTDAPPMRANSAARVTVASVEPEPDAPHDPLPPGAFNRYMSEQLGDDPEALEREPRSGTTREQAADALADAIPALRRLLKDAGSGGADISAAVRALSAMAESPEKGGSAGESTRRLVTHPQKISRINALLELAMSRIMESAK